MTSSVQRDPNKRYFVELDENLIFSMSVEGNCGNLINPSSHNGIQSALFMKSNLTHTRDVICRESEYFDTLSLYEKNEASPGNIQKNSKALTTPKKMPFENFDDLSEKRQRPRTLNLPDMGCPGRGELHKSLISSKPVHVRAFDPIDKSCSMKFSPTVLEPWASPGPFAVNKIRPQEPDDDDDDNDDECGADCVSSKPVKRKNNTCSKFCERSKSIDFITASGESRVTVQMDLQNSNSNVLGKGRHSTVYFAKIFNLEYDDPSFENNPNTIDDYPNEACRADGERVAVKFCHQDAISTAHGITEAAVLKCLVGENSTNSNEIGHVVTLIDTIEGAEMAKAPFPFNFALVLENADIGTLADFCFGTKKLNLDCILNWSRDLFKGLYEIHSNHIVHLDIKPHNLLITSAPNRLAANKNPQLKNAENSDGDKVAPENYSTCTSSMRLLVSDFGTAQVKGTVVKDACTTSYAPPESLVIGTDKIAHNSFDVYAAGVVLYTMLTGREPFAACTSMTGIHLILAIRNGFEAGSQNPWNLRPGIDITDPRVTNLVSLAKICVSSDSNSRPSAYAALRSIESII